MNGHGSITLKEATRQLNKRKGILFKERIKVGNSIRKLAHWVLPNYWKCTHCSKVSYLEEEISCWNCGRGEMIYHG